MTKTRVEAVKAARVWCLAALLAFAGLAHAELVGPVVAIQDGDTIDVLVNRQPVRVRLAKLMHPRSGKPSARDPGRRSPSWCFASRSVWPRQGVIAMAESSALSISGAWT